jgi:hypothetical protein
VNNPRRIGYYFVHRKPCGFFLQAINKRSQAGFGHQGVDDDNDDDSFVVVIMDGNQSVL